MRKILQYWIEDPLRAMSQPVQFTVEGRMDISVGAQFVRSARLLNSGNLPVFKHSTNINGVDYSYFRVYNRESVDISYPITEKLKRIEEYKEPVEYTTYGVGIYIHNKIAAINAVDAYAFSDSKRFESLLHIGRYPELQTVTTRYEELTSIAATLSYNRELTDSSYDTDSWGSPRSGGGSYLIEEGRLVQPGLEACEAAREQAASNEGGIWWTMYYQLAAMFV